MSDNADSGLINQNSVVLITGAGKRVGATISHILHRAGMSIAIHCNHSIKEANLLANSLNCQRANSARVFQTDILKINQLDCLIGQVLAYFGRLDGLVNNASTFYPTQIGSVTKESWSNLIGSNFEAPFFLSQAAAPALKKSRGAIVNIIDIHAERPLPGYSVYCAAKSGLHGLTRALAIELAPEVRVNGVAPGAILWPEDGQFNSDEQQQIIDHSLLKRCGTPDDIARTVRFLLLDAPYITGQVIAVDGGRSVHL
jgi:pteridine reductase